MEQYKALQRLICEELNVKTVQEFICKTEKGELFICYDLQTDELYLLLGKDKVNKPVLLQKIVLEIIPEMHESIIKIIKADKKEN